MKQPIADIWQTPAIDKRFSFGVGEFIFYNTLLLRIPSHEPFHYIFAYSASR
jgi:hypothetical protein